MRSAPFLLLLLMSASPVVGAENAPSVDPFASPLADPFGMAEEPYVFPDHLEFHYSDGGTLEFGFEGNLVVNAVLRDAFRREVVLRVIVSPSFLKDYAVGLAERSGAFFIFTLVPDIQLNRHPDAYTVDLSDPDEMEMNAVPGEPLVSRMAAILTPALRESGVTRYEIEITPELAGRLVDVWKAMLLRARYAPDYDHFGADGVFYRFSYSGLPPMHAVTWAPDSGTSPAMLADIANLMRELCEQRDPAIAARLSEEVDALLARMMENAER